jgi:hypothetical protein
LPNSHEDLVEHFLLTPGELELVLKSRGDANRCGLALLLKTLPHLGYLPDRLDEIPPELREFVAGQIRLLWDWSASYPWHSSTFDYHLAQVREATGWRFATAADKEALESWLRQHGAYQAHTDELLLAAACLRLRSLRIELPTESELERVVSAALNGFYQDVHRQIADGTPADARTRIDELLKVVEPATVSALEQLKADPGKPGIDNLNGEIGKLQIIRAVGLSSEAFSGLPWKVLQLLKRRATNETATEMREHPDLIRYGLMGCFLYVRGTEVTDYITRMAVELIQRLDKRSETQRSFGSCSPMWRALTGRCKSSPAWRRRWWNSLTASCVRSFSGRSKSRRSRTWSRNSGPAARTCGHCDSMSRSASVPAITGGCCRPC